MVKPDNPFPGSGSAEPSDGAVPLNLGSVPKAQAQPATVPPVFSAAEDAGQFNEEIDCRSCREALAAATHDLKTPVSILSGYIELMLSEKLGPLSERQRGALQEMNGNVRRLSGFVKNFLALGAFRNASVELQVATADLNACLADIIQVWLSSFQKKGVALFFAPSELLLPFSFDYFKVQHVVSNLLDNALKFSPAGGSVWITAELYLWERRSRQNPACPAAEVDRRRALPSVPNTVRVIIADSGPGIPPEYHQEIFQEYFRVNHATEGHGLGLAIAQRLVNRFGGKIWVESEPGLGAKFAFLLPLHPTR
jgi:signal transduction histidine kinase